MLKSGGDHPLAREENRQGEQVGRRLRARIAEAGGWIPFSQFMECALFEPASGYYTSGRVRFGAGGDFVTAPELSPLFAQCLARQVAEVLGLTGGGDVVEFGAGSGRMARDLLAALVRLGVRPGRYRIVEVSPALRERQRAHIARSPPLTAEVEWLDAPPTEAWRGIALANEVLDALPVERFRIAGAGCEALGVAMAGDGLRFEARPAGPALAAAVAALREQLPHALVDGFVSEWCPSMPGWIASAGLALCHGAILVTDYGLPRTHYYHPSRHGGTLAAFYRHGRVDDVLARPGLQDLTAWVDFSALRDAAEAAGLTVAGFATQAHALAALGIDQELAALQQDAAERERYRLAQSAQMLMMPGEMGERFKLLALTRGIAAPLTAFNFRDLSLTL